MQSYPDSLTLREARAQFFAANIAVFGADGGYDKKWVRVEIGPIPVFFPNIDARKGAVRLHDLHHIATGYSTQLTGEAEIGAWEVASGCGKYWIAWLLNMWAFALGLVIAPRLMFRAFVRGRHTGNLYHDGEYHDALLDESLGALRARLRLDQENFEPSAADVLSFVLWSALSVLTVLAPGALFIAVIAACWWMLL